MAAAAAAANLQQIPAPTQRRRVKKKQRDKQQAWIANGFRNGTIDSDLSELLDVIQKSDQQQQQHYNTPPTTPGKTAQDDDKLQASTNERLVAENAALREANLQYQAEIESLQQQLAKLSISSFSTNDDDAVVKQQTMEEDANYAKWAVKAEQDLLQQAKESKARFEAERVAATGGGRRNAPPRQWLLLVGYIIFPK